MRSLLLRKSGLPLLFLTFLLGLLARPASATHLLGGEARYRYIGISPTAGRPFRYEVTFSIYINCEDDPGNPSTFSNVPFGRAGIGIQIYDKATNQLLANPDNPAGTVIPGTNVTGTNGQNVDPDANIQANLYPAERISNPIITPPPPVGCTITAGCVRLVTYSAIIDLPVSVQGYYAVYSDLARNNSVTNLNNPGNAAQLIYVYMPPGPLLPNQSPVFTDTAVVLVCANADTVTLINNAFDADGDRLTYSFYTPYDRQNGSIATFTPPPPTVQYQFGYSLAQPFGAGGYAFINANTGLTRYFVPDPGDYVVGVIANEHRIINGRDSVISSTLREVQLKVRTCPVLPAPTLQFTGGQTSISVEEGQTATFTATANVATGNSIRLTATSPLLDGTSGFNATFNGQQGTGANQPIVVNGTTSLTGIFRFVSTCGSAGIYNVNLAARDQQGCPVKTTSIPYVITVSKPAAPASITGNAQACPNTTATYTAVGAAPGVTAFQWNVVGGLIQGSSTGSSITVLWNTPGTDSVSVRTTSALGCPSPWVRRAIEVFTGATATFNGLQANYCLNGPAVTLTGAPIGGTFSITGTGGTTNLVGNVFTPTVAGTFQVTYTVVSTGGCNTPSQPFTVVVNPLPTVALGTNLAAAYCANDAPVTLAGTVNGAAATSGFTINGTPATVFDPAVLGPGTYTVVLTGTGVGNCQNTATRTVTVNAVPVVALTGLTAAYCKNAAAVTLTATANGQPVTGANAVFTIDGTTASQLNPANLTVGFHTVRVTGAGTNGCRGRDSARVEIKALPVLAFANLDPAYCQDATPVTLSGTIDGITGGGSFTIDGQPATVFNPANLTPGTHTVVFNATGTNGCANSLSQTVRVNALPVVVITAPATATIALCQNDAPITLTGTLNGAATATLTFTLNGNPITVLDPRLLTPGTYTLVATGIDPTTNCRNTTTRSIEIKALPVVDITGLQNAYCKDAAPVNLTGTVNGAAGGTFTIDGTPASVLNPANLSVGQHLVVMSGTGANSCSTTDSVRVQINALPVVAFTGLNAAYCQDAAPVTLAATLDGATNLGTVTFTIDGQPATTLDPAALTPGPHTVAATGTLTATGCDDVLTQTVTINALPTVAITGLQPAYCVSATPVNLTATVNGNTSGGSVTYTINGNPATTFDPTTLGVGTYTVVATGTLTATGCINTATQTVVVNALPAVAFTGLQAAYCKDAAPVTLAATLDGATNLGTVTFTVNGQPATVLDPAALPAGTYTVVATGILTATTCQNTTTQTVVINALPTVAFTGLNATYCKDAAAVTLVANINGAAANGTATFTIDGQPATTFDPATLALGPHTVVATGTLTATGCVNTTTQTVTINPLPTVAITGLNAAYCVDAAPVNLAATLDGASNLGTVTFTINGTPATTLNPSVLGPGTYTVIATGTLTATTCQNTTQQTVTINALPAVAITNLNPAYCVGSAAVALSATVNGGAGNVNFTINGQPATSFDPTALPAGTYTVVATGTDGNTCINTSTQTVVINALPTVAITGLNAAYCTSAAAVTLAGTVNGAAGTVTFTIDGTPATTLDPATLTPGTHTVVITGTDGNTCQNTATQTVTINALPNVTATATQNTICLGESITLNAGGATIYSWTDGTNTFTGAAVTLSPTATTTYTVTGTEPGTTCQNTATVTVTVNPKPTGDPIFGPPSVCPGLTGVVYSVTNPSFQNYQWIVRGGTINGANTGSTVTVDWGASSTTARVQLVSLANGTNCPSDTVTLNVTVNQVLLTQTPTTTQPSVCVNAGPQTYQIPVPTISSTYSWALTGTAVGTISSGQGTSTIVIDWTQPGTATLVVTETSNTPLANCFGTSQPLNLTILAAPDATLAVQGPAASCADGAPLTFSLGGGAGSTYAWTVNNTPQTTTGNALTFNATTAGTYTIGVQETNTGTCVGPVITTQLVINAVPSTTLNGPSSICSSQLTNQTFTATGLPGSTYQWTVMGGTITGGQGTGSITVDFDGINPPSVSAVETSAAGCAGQAAVLPPSFDIASTVLDLASVDQQTPTQNVLAFGVQNAPAQARQIVVMRRDFTGTNFTQVGTAQTSDSQFTDTSADPNNAAYVYRLDYINLCGTVLNSIEQGTVLLKATAEEASGNVKLEWNAYTGSPISGYEVLRTTSTPGVFDVVGTVPASATTYTAAGIGRDAFNQTFRVRALLNNGTNQTSYSNESKVQFENKLTTYNIITPNGDNLNDELVIENVALYPNNDLIVFNRWGREVYRKTNYDNSWKADDLPAGTYYYLFTVKGGQSIKAWFQIMR